MDITHADCFAVFVAEQNDLKSLPAVKDGAMERHLNLNFARNLHIETQVLVGNDHAKTIVEFARLHNARQIFLPRLVDKGMDRVRSKSFVNQVVGLAKDMEVTIVADQRQERSAG